MAWLGCSACGSSSSLEGVTHLNLSGNKLTSVPTSIRDWNKVSLIDLDLSNNQISGTITDGTFASNSKLVSLNLGDNEITVIEADAFNGLPKLKTIDLSENSKLSTIESGTFENLPALETLTVDSIVAETLGQDILDQDTVVVDGKVQTTTATATTIGNSPSSVSLPSATDSSSSNNKSTSTTWQQLFLLENEPTVVFFVLSVLIGVVATILIVVCILCICKTSESESKNQKGTQRKSNKWVRDGVRVVPKKRRLSWKVTTAVTHSVAKSVQEKHEKGLEIRMTKIAKSHSTARSRLGNRLAQRSSLKKNKPAAGDNVAVIPSAVAHNEVKKPDQNDDKVKKSDQKDVKLDQPEAGDQTNKHAESVHFQG